MMRDAVTRLRKMPLISPPYMTLAMPGAQAGDAGQCHTRASMAFSFRQLFRAGGMTSPMPLGYISA